MSVKRTPPPKPKPTMAKPPEDARMKRRAEIARESLRDTQSSSEEDGDDDSDMDPLENAIRSPPKLLKPRKDPERNHTFRRPEPVKNSKGSQDPKESNATHHPSIGGAFEDALERAGLAYLFNKKGKKKGKKEKGKAAEAAMEEAAMEEAAMERAKMEAMEKKREYESFLEKYNKKKEKWEDLRDSLLHFGGREGQKVVTSEESDDSDEGPRVRPEGVAPPKANKSRREKNLPTKVPSIVNGKKWVRSTQPLGPNDNIRKWGVDNYSEEMEAEKMPAELKKFKKESQDLWNHPRPHVMFKKRSMIAKVASRNLQETMSFLNGLAKFEADEMKRNAILAARDSILKSVALDNLARSASQKRMLEVYYRLDEDFKKVDSSANGALVEGVLPSVAKDKVSEAFKIVHNLGRANKANNLNFAGGGGDYRYSKGYGGNWKSKYGNGNGFKRNEDFKRSFGSYGGSHGGNQRNGREAYYFDDREERYRDRAPYGRFEASSRSRQNPRGRGRSRNNANRRKPANRFHRGSNPS